MYSELHLGQGGNDGMFKFHNLIDLVFLIIKKIKTPLEYSSGVPKGVRTPVTAVKGRCPRPLDDGDTVDISPRR